MIPDVRIAQLGLDVSLKLAKEAIPLGVQLQNAGEAGQRYDTCCRRCHELLFAWHIGSGEGRCSEISGRAGDVPRTLVVAALLLAITAIATALVVITSLAAALTALALVTMTVALALALVVSLAAVAATVIAPIVAMAIALTSIVALTLAALTLTMALAMTISATMTVALLALALSSASVMTTPTASLAWGVTIRPFGMVCWPHVFRPVV